MRTVLTYLQESPDAVPGEDGSPDDMTIPEWPKSSANLHQPPVRPARRVQPWAGGIAFVVAATSVIAVQHYLQSGAPVLTPTDRSRAVVSSLIGDTIMHPAAPPAKPAPAPAEPSRQVAERASSGDDTPRIQITMVESPMLSPPSIDGEAKPPDIGRATPEITGRMAQVIEPPAVRPADPLVKPEPAPETSAAGALPMTPTPPDEAISEPQWTRDAEPLPQESLPQEPAATAQPEPAPSEPAAPEPTAETAPEPEPPATITETAPSEGADAPGIESPAAATPSPDPVPPEPSATIAIPEPAPQEALPEQATPQEPEPEPTLAEPSPPPEPVAEPPAPEPAAVTAAPPPPPAPAPVAPKQPSVAETVLLEKGDRLLALGDIASARLLYETAAAGGSARGALLAGRTLDPGYLRSLGTRGVTGDPARAAAWYEKAAKLGDESATSLLEALESR